MSKIQFFISYSVKYDGKIKPSVDGNILNTEVFDDFNDLVDKLKHLLERPTNTINNITVGKVTKSVTNKR